MRLLVGDGHIGRHLSNILDIFDTIQYDGCIFKHNETHFVLNEEVEMTSTTLGF